MLDYDPDTKLYRVKRVYVPNHVLERNRLREQERQEQERQEQEKGEGKDRDKGKVHVHSIIFFSM